jgi:hypothetical protein
MNVSPGSPFDVITRASAGGWVLSLGLVPVAGRGDADLLWAYLAEAAEREWLA